MTTPRPDSPRPEPQPTKQALLSQLADLNAPPETRQEAALELGRQANPAIANQLVTLLWDEPDFFVRETITWALVRMGRDFLPRVADGLTSDRAETRAQAVHVLSKIGAPEYADALLTLLNDPAPEVATKARWALAQLHDTRLTPTLISELGETRPRERDLLDQLLAGYRADSVPALADVIQRGELAARLHATEILLSIGSPEADEAVPALRSAIRAIPEVDINNDGEAATQHAEHVAVSALMTLAQLTSPAARDAILEAQASPSEHVAAVARRLEQAPPKRHRSAKIRELRSRKTQTGEPHER